MKNIFTVAGVLLIAQTQAQTITYAAFSQALDDTISINLANNSSFSASLTSTTGSGVTWDASALTPLSGAPTIHMSFHAPASTPQGSLYPLSNYAWYDPALSAMISVEYGSFVTDSITVWGTYSPDGAHEIFQDPDKHLVFPFVFGQTFTDHYAKTNYSDATTISSYQTGNRTVTFSGFGTLILPQGPFANVALVAETRTNSLGPDSYVYNWYDINSGKKLLYRSENAGNITTVWCTDAVVTGISENSVSSPVLFFPQPLVNQATLRLDAALVLNDARLVLYNAMGQQLKSIGINAHEVTIDREGLVPGTCFYRLVNHSQTIGSGKIIVQ